MGLPARKFEKHYTYRDYRTWPEDERWELLGGVAYAMGGPTSTHQRIASNLHGALWNYLRGKDCQVFTAPLDVFLPPLHQIEEEDVDTVVQPDLLVICDPNKIRDRGIWGAPDLVVEILSPSTSRKDQNEKYHVYERSGVREYWVVDPTGEWVQRYVLGANGKFGIEVTIEKHGTLESLVLSGFSVEVAELWPTGGK